MREDSTLKDVFQDGDYPICLVNNAVSGEAHATGYVCKLWTIIVWGRLLKDNCTPFCCTAVIFIHDDSYGKEMSL